MTRRHGPAFEADRHLPGHLRPVFRSKRVFAALRDAAVAVVRRLEVAAAAWRFAVNAAEICRPTRYMGE